MFNYWSFPMPEENGTPTMAESLSLTMRELTHFLSETRWSRTFKRVN
jgi:hypothetical protein